MCIHLKAEIALWRAQLRIRQAGSSGWGGDFRSAGAKIAPACMRLARGHITTIICGRLQFCPASSFSFSTRSEGRLTVGAGNDLSAVSVFGGAGGR